MRTVSPEWKAAMSRRGVETRRMVVIYLDGAAVRSFITGGSALFGAQPSILSVSSHSASIDPWTCAVSVGERSIRLKLDPSVRDLVANNHLEGRRVEIFLGAVGLDFSHWPREWVGQILDTPTAADNSVTIRAGDVFSCLRDRQVPISLASVHPLEAIVDIFHTAAVPDDLWVESTFDYRREDLRDISHLVVSRAATRSYFQDPGGDPPSINAWSAVQDLFGILNAAITFDETGRLVFDRFDSDAASVRHWSSAQISGFRMETALANRHDEITVEFLKSGARAKYVDADETSAAEHGFSGSDPRPKPKSIGSDWINGIAIQQGLQRTTETSIEPVTLFGVENNGISGLRRGALAERDPVDIPTSTERTFIRIADEIIRVRDVICGIDMFGETALHVNVNRSVLGTVRDPHVWPTFIGRRIGIVTAVSENSTTRAYFEDTGPTGGISYTAGGGNWQTAEINPDPERFRVVFFGADGLPIGDTSEVAHKIKVGRAVEYVPDGFEEEFYGPDPIPDVDNKLYYGPPGLTPEQHAALVGMIYRIYERPDYDAVPDREIVAHDLTIPMQMARDRERFIHGVSIVEERAPLTEYDVGLSDFVSFDEPRCVFKDCDGATQNQVWQKIGESVDESGSEPSILVKLCFVRHEVEE